MPLQQRKIVISEEDLRYLIAKGFRTAFREVTDHPLAMPIHRLLGLLPPEEWNSVINFVVSGLKPRTEKTLP